MPTASDPSDADHHARALSDDRFFAAFVAEYDGPHPPLDALLWLAEPERASPSGRHGPRAGLAERRAALYAPDAPTGAAAEYEEAVAAAEADEAVTRAAVHRVLEAERAAAEREPQADAEAPRSRRPVAVLVASVVVAALAVAVVVTLAVRAGPSAAPTSSPSPLKGEVASSVVVFPGSATTRQADLDDLTSTISQPGATLADFFGRHADLRPQVLQMSSSDGFDGVGVGPARVALPALLVPGRAGTVVVYLACAQNVGWRWSVSGTNASNEAVILGASRGADCGDRLMAAALQVKPGDVPTSITISVPAGIRYQLEVDVGSQ